MAPEVVSVPEEVHLINQRVCDVDNTKNILKNGNIRRIFKFPRLSLKVHQKFMN